jgi:oxepin-CoA hydrolase/3-oxo-5,6-dehydrosuberyl-CoA semialdehyde dehydrogenase
MGYTDLDHAASAANRGGAASWPRVITHDPAVARSPCDGKRRRLHGRIYINNRTAPWPRATGHGSPLPHMVHGGPGRAGGGEELGGVRGVMHYMQRTAVQGSPDI